MFGKLLDRWRLAEQIKVAPLHAEQALRDFEKKILEALLPDFATGEIWDDQFNANYLDPIRKLTDETANEWEEDVARFRELQAKVSDQMGSMGITTWKSNDWGNYKEKFESIMLKASLHRDTKRRFRELDREGIQEFFREEVAGMLQYLRVDTTIADRPSDTVDKKGLRLHEGNAFIVRRVEAVVELMELACLAHFANSNPPADQTEIEARYPSLHYDDHDLIRMEYPVLLQFEKLATTLGDLVRQEQGLFEKTWQLQVYRDCAHALYGLFYLHKFPNDVSFRHYDSDHQRLLYPTTILPASQNMAMDMNGMRGAIEAITKAMSGPQAAMFLQTLTYLVVSAIVMGTRRSRLPAVAASLYVQAAERGMGLLLIGMVVDKDFEKRLRATFEALNLEWKDQDNDIRVAEVFIAAKDLLPSKPKFLRTEATLAQ